MSIASGLQCPAIYSPKETAKTVRQVEERLHDTHPPYLMDI